MERLTHKRENGIKRGYWSPNKKQELVDRLAMYEDREDAKDTNVLSKWIMSLVEYRMKWYNEDEATAKSKIPEQNQVME